METNIMSELGLGLKTVQSAIDQMHAWPTSMLIVFALVVLGVAIRVSHQISNRWAPIVILGVAIALNVLLGDTGKVDPTQRHPHIVLGLYGLGLGVISLFIYGLVGKRVEKLFKQFDENETIHITKDKHEHDNDPKET